MSRITSIMTVKILLLASMTGIAGCAAYADPSEEDVAVLGEELTLCGPDSRSPVTSLIPYPMGATGRILRAEGGWCTAAVIGPNKVLTAQHCLSASSTGVTFQPQWGIAVEGAGPGSLTSTRFVAGRDDTSGGPGDWGIVTLNGNLQTMLGNNYQVLSREPGNPTGGAVGHVGYHGDGYVERPGRQSCSYTLGAGGVNDHLVNLICDIEGGSSGGPAYRLLNPSSGVIVAVTAAGGSPDCSSPPTGANGVWYAYAPDNPGGVSAAYLPDGRAELFATDQDWSQVLRKAQVSSGAGSSWEPWKRSVSGFVGGRKISVINLQDGRRQMTAVTSSGVAKTRWENIFGGSWTAWGDITLPANIKDVASSGGSGLTTHLFFLSTGNTVYRMHKLGDANSGWSNPTSMGTVPGATALAATYAHNQHRVLVTDASGVVTSEGSGASFSAFVRRGGSIANGLSSISAGTLADGRLHVLGSTPTGGVRRLFRSTAGAWTSWSSLPIPVPPRAGGFHTMTAVKLPTSGGQQIIAVSNDGNLFTIWETGGGNFTTSWARAYH